MSCIFLFFKDRTPENLNIEDLIHFNTLYIIKKNLSASFQNQVINAVKLFYKNRFNRTMELNFIRRPRSEKRLPNVLSKEEVK